jgi:hypothetical protein
MQAHLEQAHATVLYSVEESLLEDAKQAER